MALPSSGAISIAQIAGEFGGTAPHSLSEFYGVASGIPTSGTISLSHFYGKSNAFTFTLSANTAQPNIRSLATSAGWNGSAPLICNITAALINSLDLGSTAFSGGLTLNISAGTRIGGVGGVFGGSSAGPAIKTRVPVIINNLGIISGGGGAGGSGARASVTYGSSTVTSDGGDGGRGQGFSSVSSLTITAAQNGLEGIQATFSGSVAGGQTKPWVRGGTGGRGGDWGQSGAIGFDDFSYGGSYDSFYVNGSGVAGNQPGAAVDGNSFVSWSSQGTRLGTLIN